MGKINLALSAMIFGIATGAGFVSGFLETNPDRLASVRKLSVENRCGGYDHATGEFRWERPTTAEDMIQAMPKLKTPDPAGIRIK